MGSKRTETISTLVMVALLGLLYLKLPDHRYFVDGLNTAWLFETSDGWVVHPHHPLFPLLPQMIYRLLGGESSGMSALGFLLLWASIFGIIACWGMILLMRLARVSVWTVLIIAGLFAFSSSIWYFSATPNQYSTALAIHIFTMIFLVRSCNRSSEPMSIGDAMMIGVLLGVAVLFHQVNALLLFPLIYTVLSKGGTGRQRVLSLSVAIIFALIVAIGFTIVAGFSLIGINTPAGFIEWQHSYVAQGRYWAQGIMDALVRSVRGAFDLHVAHTFHPEGLFGDWQGVAANPKLLLIRAAQAFVLLFLLIETIRALIEWARSRLKPRLQTLGLVSAIPFFVFALMFTPESVNYRIFYLPGFLLILAPAIEDHFHFRRPGFRHILLPLLVIIVLFLTNLTVRFLPESKPENNPYLAEAGLLAMTVGEGDLVIYSGAEEDYLRAQYLRYFARADTVILPELIELIRNNPDSLVEDLGERLQNGNITLVHEDALYSAEDIEWINDFYLMDINLVEITDFFRQYTVEISSMEVNEKNYVFVVPLEDVE